MRTTQCPRCGWLMGPLVSACPRCGLPQGVELLPQAPAVAGPMSYKVCRRCGQPAVLAMPACGRCGQPYPAVPVGPAPARTRSSAFLRMAVVFVVAVLGAAAFRLLWHPTGTLGRGSAIALLAPDGKRRVGSLVESGPVSEEQINRRLMEAGAAMGGDVEVSLAWNTLTDLDIQVRDPSGELITAEHTKSASGGAQDVDANPTPMNAQGVMRDSMGLVPGAENVEPIPEFMVDTDSKLARMPEGLRALMDMRGAFGNHAPPRYTHRPIEHIYWVHAPRGTYIVYASCYWWREPNQVPLPFTVQVRYRGTVFSQTCSTIGPDNYVTTGAPPKEVCRFVIR